MNEVINELIAQEITSKMHQQGIYIFDKPQTIIKSQSDYALANFIIQDFYEKYKMDIIKSRIEGISHIEAKVGRENFQRLNRLLTKFEEEIYTTNSLEFNNSKHNSKFAKTTLEFENEVKEILKQMEEYDMTRQKQI